VECGLFWCVFVGLHSLFEPIFSDSPEQVNRRIQNGYNQLVIWPVRLTSTAGAETRAYFEDEPIIQTPEQVGSPVMVIRPSVVEAKLATEPWQWTRGTIGLMSVCAASLIIGVLTYLVPPREVKPLPDYSESQLASIANFKDFPESSIEAQLVRARIAEYNPEIRWRAIDWGFITNKGAISFTLTLPHYEFQPFIASRTWTLHQKSKLFEESDWPVHEAEYVNDFGRLVYVWHTGFDKNSAPVSSDSTWLSSLSRRMENSLLGRLLPARDTPHLFMTTLLLEPNEPLSLGGKKAHRVACAAFTKAIAERTNSAQP
jgi:hypothetical protein